MITEQKFKPNKKQQECIDNINGKFLVLAGPGTGKTFTIIERIASMLEKGIEPEKMLCLTFTDAAANEMKIRLEHRLGRNCTDIGIYTYHGFCYEIIENYPEEFELPANVKIITDSASRAFIKECIDEISPKAFRTNKNDPYFYIDTIKYRIDEIKKNRLTKEKYFYNLANNKDWEPKLIQLKKKLEEKNQKGDTRTATLLSSIENTEKEIERANELWEFYELYQTKMQERNYIDFNDIISLVLDKFEDNPAFLEEISKKYEYLLVDEYQDTNSTQNSIIFTLTKSLKSGNVFVVGDDDQIIYTFQGAKLDNIEKFLTTFPETEVICLTENMRSTQSILDVSREIANQDNKRLEANPQFVKYGIQKKLEAKNKEIIQKDKPVRCYAYADYLQECIEIISEIDELIKSTECPTDENGNKNLSQIAILTRRNIDLEIYAEMLKERNIPYELKDGKSIFAIRSSITLYFYMQALANPELNSDKLFKLILSPPFSVHPKDYETLYKEYSKYSSFTELLKEIDTESLVEGEKIKAIAETFEYLQKYRANENLKNTVLEIGAKTGIFDYYLNSDINKSENIAGIKKIIDEAAGFAEGIPTASLDDFVEYLDIALNDNIDIKTDKAPVSLNAVQLCTYYSSKGREFEYVYMPTLLSNKWESDNGSLRAPIPLAPEEYKTEDELKEMKISDRIKVMYVGMTRAKHTLRLSYVKFLNGKAKKPSVFISNIQDMLEKENETFEYDETSYLEEITKSIQKRDYDYEKDFHSLVDNILKDKYFSPTSVNTYLKCPRQYLYNDILKLASKSGNADNMLYGTSVHEACEYAVNYALENHKYPEKQDFVNEFKQKLSTLPVSDRKARTILEERGEKALSQYYAQLITTPISMLYKTEEKITLELDGVKFKGYIDRIDKKADGSFIIYDYKTGNAKTESMICPEGIHEDYYNQIGLYKYYFEKASGKTVSEIAFIFPEDYTKNLYLNLTNEDCVNIEQKFKKAISDIKSYNFEPSYDKEVCKYCQYKEFCLMEII